MVNETPQALAARSLAGERISKNTFRQHLPSSDLEQHLSCMNPTQFAWRSVSKSIGCCYDYQTTTQSSDY